jgi:hypothetical protein
MLPSEALSPRTAERSLRLSFGEVTPVRLAASISLDGTVFRRTRWAGRGRQSPSRRVYFFNRISEFVSAMRMIPPAEAIFWASPGVSKDAASAGAAGRETLNFLTPALPSAT